MYSIWVNANDGALHTEAQLSDGHDEVFFFLFLCALRQEASFPVVYRLLQAIFLSGSHSAFLTNCELVQGTAGGRRGDYTLKSPG